MRTVNEEDKKYEHYKHQSPLDIIRKRQLIFYGYIRKQKQFYPKEIIQMIHNFYFIKILNYKIKGIGYNQYGQQGIGNYENIYTLTTAKTYQKQIKNIINGWKNSYIIFTDSTYECCGYNYYGQLGISTRGYNIKRVVKINNIKINNIFSSPLSHHAFCVDNDNKIYVCGKNYNNKWTQINTQIKIQKIATGNWHTTFINNNGQLFVCGNNGDGVLGLGKETTKVQKITQIPTQTTFMDVYCGHSHTLALDCNGQIWSWGYGFYGQLGHGDINNRYIPTKIQYFMNRNIQIMHICCGRYHSLVLSNTNKIYTFGGNSYSQCGNNNNKDVLTPELNYHNNENIITIKCGWYHNMVKNRENEYYLWGYNEYNHQCIVRSNNRYTPKHVKKPLLFEWKHFMNKYEEIIDIFLGSESTRVLIGNTKENNNL